MRWTFPQLTTFTLSWKRYNYLNRAYISTNSLAARFAVQKKKTNENRCDAAHHNHTPTHQKKASNKPSRHTKKNKKIFNWIRTLLKTDNQISSSPPTTTFEFLLIRHWCIFNCKLLFSSLNFIFGMVNNVFFSLLFRVSCTIFVHITNK